MRSLALIFFMAALPCMISACSSQPDLPDNEQDNGKIDDSKNVETMKAHTIKLTIGDKILTATPADNSSAKAFVELLAKGAITVEMEDYANMEKVGTIGTTLPRNDKPMTTEPGDLILYQGHYLTIYYEKNSYTLTLLGKINNVNQEELKRVLGKGNVTVTLSLEE